MMDLIVRCGMFFFCELFIIVFCYFNCILYVFIKLICFLVCCIFFFFYKLWKVLSDLFGDYFDEEGFVFEWNNVSIVVYIIGELCIEI